MLVTKADADTYGLLNELVGSSVVFQYQKTGGILVCPKCGKYMGTPKHSKSGVIIYSPFRKKCSDCGEFTIIKGAEIVRRPGTTTRAILRTELHGIIKAKVILNEGDLYNKTIARAFAYEKLMKKAKTVEPNPLYAMNHD